MHLDYAVPLGLFHVHEHAVAEDPCVVDEDVEAAEAVDRLLDHPLRAGEVRDVLAVRNRRAAECLDFAHHVMGGALIRALTGDRGAEVIHDDPRPFRGEAARRGEPLSPSGSGDQRNAAL